jgi:hypothetical protein
VALGIRDRNNSWSNLETERMRRRSHNTKFLTWSDVRCRLCNRFIKSKESYGHPKYCKGCYLKMKSLLDRGNNIFEANIRFYIRESVMGLLPFSYNPVNPHLRGRIEY